MKSEKECAVNRGGVKNEEFRNSAKAEKNVAAEKDGEAEKYGGADLNTVRAEYCFQGKKYVVVRHFVGDCAPGELITEWAAACADREAEPWTE